MKPDLHPAYEETTYVCSCGNTFTSHSTKGGTLRIELCNKCHPFYTGQQKFVDTGGRVQRFTDKFANAAAASLEKEQAALQARRAAAEAAEAEKKRQREEKAAAKAARAAEFERKKPAKAEEPAAEEVEVAEEAVAEEAVTEETPAEEAPAAEE
ncbi:MAG: 50S ribosomal protein L31 [Actinomycetia bacterium]|nr:50S ribosomal protein L31 [Actinomycetes bacterium]